MTEHLRGCLRLQGWGTCDCGEEQPGAQPQPVATPWDCPTASQTVAQGVGGTPAHPRTRDRLRAFAWPCEKRTAHESHGDCPGVMGHPLTMIGGGYVEEAKTDGD